MRRLFISLILLALVIPQIQAQLVQVSGYIYTKDSIGVVPFANIYNRKSRTGTQSNIEGFFTILVAPGDSVEVTAIGFERAKLTLPATYSGGSFYYNVLLNPIVYILPDAKVYYMNYEKFKNDFEAMKIPEEKRYITIDKGQITSRTPAKETFGYTLNGPFSWLYNKFSRRSKEIARIAELKSGELTEYKANQRLTKDFIMMATGLPEDKVFDFAGYCDIGAEALANYTNYDLIVTLQRCLDVYKKDKNLTDADLGIKSSAVPEKTDSVNTNTNTDPPK